MSNDPNDTVVDWRKLIKKAPPIRLQTEPKNDNNLITSLNEGEKNLRGYEMSTLGKNKKSIGHEHFAHDDQEQKRPSE